MKQNMAHTYQIMDRIGFIKNMISTHQKKLITEPKRSSSYLETSQTEVVRRSRDSFHKQQSHLNETSTSDYFSIQENTNLRLLREELKITKSLLDKRSIELNQLLQDNQGIKSDMIRLKEENEELKYQLKKVVREKEDYQEELTFKLKKIDSLNEEIQRLEKSQNQMICDLKEAREAMQNIRQYENEVKLKEKQLLNDWQKLEKDKLLLKERQSQLLILQEQLQIEVENIQSLKNRITQQEKKIVNVQQEKQNQLKEKEQQLQMKEKIISFKELKVEKEEKLKDEVDQKLLILEMNEDLWKKRVQAEFTKIKEVQQKLKIIK
ncbi:unnamed protein product (macronuclear) [Paramecium tetraurelia]|uniref:Uncharacterized protein n=1 Tax=Paramecium tetraurelia TaxID=5888 RepID=A0DQ48_PARTE|nr:uncharacterized protein GSPATT00002565001 [Paramecium tetraurelia]CAK85165.1 unnamed protein product [Paramecium tetraurelia]|eukprot:XP_001452562.1 hypothetical protein (macronuclear) [Paramecium tetraurelia strain d4-2]